MPLTVHSDMPVEGGEGYSLPPGYPPNTLRLIPPDLLAERVGAGWRLHYVAVVYWEYGAKLEVWWFRGTRARTMDEVPLYGPVSLPVADTASGLTGMGAGEADAWMGAVTDAARSRGYRSAQDEADVGRLQVECGEQGVAG